MYMSLGLQLNDISMNNRKRTDFQHWMMWGAPLKNQNFENIFFVAKEDQKIGLVLNVHKPRSLK